jgi:hypothetical protein
LALPLLHALDLDLNLGRELFGGPQFGFLARAGGVLAGAVGVLCDEAGAGSENGEGGGAD